MVLVKRHFHFAYWELSVVYITSSIPESEKAIITANDTSAPPTVTPPTEPLHPNATWPTPSGINETEARDICEAPILQSEAFSVCSNFTVETFDVISESCMLDLQVNRFMFCRCISYFLSGKFMKQVISETTGPIFTKLSQLVDLLNCLIMAISVLQSHKGCFHGNQFYRQNWHFGISSFTCRTVYSSCCMCMVVSTLAAKWHLRSR